MYTRRLSILLVTNEVPQMEKPAAIGLSESFLDDSEFIDYIELLSASNVSYDIITPDRLSIGTFFTENIIKYSTVILTTPLSNFSDSALSVLKYVSYELGISLMSSYSNVDQRSKSFFGIRKLRRKRYLWPLKVKIIRWPRDIYIGEVVASYGPTSGFPGIRKRGFRKLALRKTLAKLIKLYNNLLLPYIKVDLESNAHVLSTNMMNKPLAWSYQYGKGTNYYFALRGDLFLDKFNEMHRLVRAGIEANSGYGMISVDLDNTMVIRLDDPGACSTDYIDNRYVLEEDDWEKISRILDDRKLSLSVVYTPGWVDDGDAETGTLYVGGEKILERKAGATYDSRLVKYIPTELEKGKYDHVSEFRGLKRLVEKGIVDVHSHGLTHLDSDYVSWSEAKNRNKDTRWYHEFYRVKIGKEVNKDKQLYSMKVSRSQIKDLFGIAPFAFIPSGHRNSPNSDILSYACGYILFSSDFTGILKENVAIRNWKIPSLFLFLKDSSNFASKSGYPFIGVIHDFELKQHGIDSLYHVIRAWESKGIKRFISLKELAVNLCLTVEGFWLEREKKLQIQISAPLINGSENMIEQSQGTEVRLRVVAPQGINPTNNNISIVGNGLSIAMQEGKCSACHDIQLDNKISIESSNLHLCLSLSSPEDRSHE